jgi:hypothetical protein
MQVFKIKGLEEWAKVSPSEILEFPAGYNGRVISMQMNTSERVEVYASVSSDMADEKLLASADGLFEVNVSSRGSLFVQVRTKGKGTVVFLKTKTADHRVHQINETKFTSIEARRRRNSDVDRMMMLMQLNEKRRDETMKAEIDAVRKEAAAAIAAKAVEQEVIEDDAESGSGRVQEQVSGVSEAPPEATGDASTGDKDS